MLGGYLYTNADDRVAEPAIDHGGAEAVRRQLVGERVRGDERGVHADQAFARLEDAPEWMGGIELADDEDAPGREHAGGLRERGAPVREMVERVDDHGGVDRVVPDRQPTGVARHRRQAPSASRARKHPRRRVDDGHLGSGDGGRRTPGTPADVEKSVDRPLGACEPVGEGLAARGRHDEVVEGCDPVEEADVAGAEHAARFGGDTHMYRGPIGRMEFAIVGWPDEGVTLRLDYRAFAYAGKFVIGAPGKAVWRTPDGSPAVPDFDPDATVPETVDPDGFDRDVLAALSFSPDRTDPSCCRLRYVTVHRARRGEGLGPRLISRLVRRLAEREYATVRIAVNNPFAYEALYKSGFAYAGERTGIAELELSRPVDGPAPTHGDAERYRAGLDRFRERDVDGSADDEAVSAFLAEREGSDPPAIEDGIGGKG